MKNTESPTKAKELLRSCNLCERRCGVNRLAGEAGFCGTDGNLRVFDARISNAEEDELVPCYTISLSGCNLRCPFCVSHKSSWKAGVGSAVSPAELRKAMNHAASRGARSVQFLGGEPTIHLAGLIETLRGGTGALKTALSSNFYFSSETAELLDGMFGLLLAGVKFWNPPCAERCLGVPHYVETVRRNLRAVACRSKVIVRLLMVPGHLKCCVEPFLAWLAGEMPGIAVNIVGGYVPPGRSAGDSALRRFVTQPEYESALRLAGRLGLNCVAHALRLSEEAASEECRLPPPDTARGGPALPSNDCEVCIRPDGRILIRNSCPELDRVFAGVVGGVGDVD